MRRVDEAALHRLEEYLYSKVETYETVSAVPMSVWSAPEDFPDWELTLIMPRTFRNSSHYLICCWLIALSNDKIFWKEELRLLILQKCKENNYRSEWMCLHHLAIIDSLDLCLYMLLESYMSVDDIWGNVIKDINLIVNRTLVRLAMCQRKKPKQKEYRRGYNDKGSRRPEHMVPIHKEIRETQNTKKTDLSNSAKKKNFLLNFLYG